MSILQYSAVDLGVQ